jgi:hypothetical protein
MWAKLMNLEEYSKDKLWLILVEAVHANVMYPTHKSYTRDVILRATPDVQAEQLAFKLDMPIGEALVILYELQSSMAKN